MWTESDPASQLAIQAKGGQWLTSLKKNLKGMWLCQMRVDNGSKV